MEKVFYRAVEGDFAARNHLANHFDSQLRAFVQVNLGKHLRDRVDVQDVVQASWIKAIESFDRVEWQGERAFFSWLCGIARNTIYGHSRRYLKYEKLELSETPQDWTSPSRDLRRNERFGRLQNALQQLSDEHREVIMLVRIEQLPIQEVAKRLGRSPNATHQLLWRAMQKLRQHIDDTDSLRLPDRRLGREAPDDIIE